ncbi:HupE/UreJ family protein [Spirosoma luteolum]
MSDFLIYLRLGFDHITDPGGYDHILFVIALTAIYTLTDWRRVLVLITAFTIGHSITLALATLQLIQYSTPFIEFLIPVTILITAIGNFSVQPATQALLDQRPLGRYGMALAFGLIHGMGFSNYLRSLLGREADILTPLLAFNIGLELGQLLIVSIVLGVSYAALRLARVSRLRWVLAVSGIVAGMAISLLLNNDFLNSLLE